MAYSWPVREGDRVAFAPHLDLWMAGIRFGNVIEDMVNEEGERSYLIDYGDGVDGRCAWFTNDDLLGTVRRNGWTSVGPLVVNHQCVMGETPDGWGCATCLYG